MITKLHLFYARLRTWAAIDAMRTFRMHFSILQRPKIASSLMSLGRNVSIFLFIRFAAIHPIKSMEDSHSSDDQFKIPRRLKRFLDINQWYRVFHQLQNWFDNFRFRKFASVEFDGEIFMTPQDFLDSLTLDHPRGLCSLGSRWSDEFCKFRKSFSSCTQWSSSETHAWNDSSFTERHPQNV